MLFVVAPAWCRRLRQPNLLLSMRIRAFLVAVGALIPCVLCACVTGVAGRSRSRFSHEEYATVSFATKGLARLAEFTGLTGLDTIAPGTHYYIYKGHPLTVRVNEWKEVEHIGFLLFSQEMRTLHPLPIYDFLERYLLAQNAVPEGTDERVLMAWDKVHYTVGDAATALRIDTATSFSESHVDLHVYKVAWTQGEEKVLEMSFYMDYQLLTGCNAIELEQMMFRKLRRSIHLPSMSAAEGLPESGTEYTSSGKFFISPLVRNDLYYTRTTAGKPWQLLSDAGRMSRSISNIMLSEQSSHAMRVNIRLDKYGLRSDSVVVEYGLWRQLCLDEGCTPYYGLKGKNDDVYRGSVFMVNETGGYLHLLSIDIPEQAFLHPDICAATARLYCYIPLHNVSDNVLRVDDFEPIK